MTDSRSSVLGAVLAGGRSSRMGRSKTLVSLGGRSLIEYPLAALRAAGLDAVVVAKEHTRMPPLELPVVVEPRGPYHPIAGVLTALDNSTGRPVLVCGCDLPFVTSRLVEHIASTDERLVVPRARGRLQPLLARYAPELFDSLAKALVAGRSLHESVSALEPTVIGEQELALFGDVERLFFNVNTPEDLARAAELLGSR